MDNNSDFDYKPHLKIAYIDPIRTVTVIDDEYPTIDDLLSGEKNDFTPENTLRLREIVDISRNSEYNWLLDIYNGKEDKIKYGTVSNRLHHSDLLILDYHLDGEDAGYCKKSIDIIKNLSNNRHFNIVAVHTKGYTDDKGSVKDVLVDIIVSLQKKPKISKLAPSLVQSIDDKLDDWEIEDPEIRNKLIESISTIHLLLLIKVYNEKICDNQFTHDLMLPFLEIHSNKPENISLAKALLIKWLCFEKLKKYDSFFNEDATNYLEWNLDDDCNWIKTEDLFITVLGKKQTPINEIPNQLLKALAHSKPHPHKLILSKLRNEIECNGSYAASNIISRKILQAAWLKDLIKTDDDISIKTNTWSIVTKLWEELSYEIKDELGDFTINLVKSLKKINTPLNYFISEDILNNDIDQIKQANCFSCSKKISTHHLITGHILSIDNAFWLCLTPMCDLVPGQKDKNNLLPITLVRMYDAKSALNSTRESMCHSLGIDIKSLPEQDKNDEIKKILAYSTQNNLLFIKSENNNNEIRILSFTVGLDGKSNPTSKDFYATNQGIFDDASKKINLICTTPSTNEDKLIQREVIGTIVAELRYEYALNLLNRLGISKSRIGLDFIN